MAASVFPSGTFTPSSHKLVLRWGPHPQVATDRVFHGKGRQSADWAD